MDKSEVSKIYGEDDIVWDEHWWGRVLKLEVRNFAYHNKNRRPTAFRVVMIEEFDGIPVEFIPQVKEVPTNEPEPDTMILCLVCDKPIEKGTHAYDLGDGAVAHLECKEAVEEPDDSSGQVGTAGDSETVGAGSPSDGGESESERAE